MILVDVALGLQFRSTRSRCAPLFPVERELQPVSSEPAAIASRAGRITVMDRLLAIIVFLALQGVGVLAGLRCHSAVCDWMWGGYWFAPAVRVPLVMLAVLVGELLLLAAVYPCNRLTTRLLRRGSC